MLAPFTMLPAATTVPAAAAVAASQVAQKLSQTGRTLGRPPDFRQAGRTRAPLGSSPQRRRQAFQTRALPANAVDGRSARVDTEDRQRGRALPWRTSYPQHEMSAA